MDRLDSLPKFFSRFAVIFSAAALFAATVSPVSAADPAPTDPATQNDQQEEETPERKSKPFPDPPLPGLKRLAPNANVWIDLPNKQLVLGGEVALRRGPLELLACLKNTKEHEAVFAIETKAYVVHAGLLALGATVGNPAKFVPEYTPARGTEIEILVEWTDAVGKKQKKDAREFVKNAKTGKAMTFPWVFGGSSFWTDPADGKKYYQAEDGDLICISNFPSAMLDVPVESSNANASLLFEAFTDNIPPEKSQVLIYLKPKLAKPAAGGKPEEKSAAPKSNSVSAAAASPAAIVRPAARLAVAMVAPPKVVVGDDVKFAITITNLGGAPATGIVLVDRFDKGLKHEIVASPIENRDLGSLGEGESRKVNVVLKATQIGRWTNSLELTGKDIEPITSQAQVEVAAARSEGATRPSVAPPSPAVPKGDRQVVSQPSSQPTRRAFRSRRFF